MIKLPEYILLEEENDSHIVYQYNPVFMQINMAFSIIAGLLIAAVFGAVLDAKFLTIFVLVFFFIWLHPKAVRERNKNIQSALKSGSVELSGEKLSKTNPMRVKISKSLL